MTEVQQPGSAHSPSNVLALHAEKQLRIEWSDGHVSVYPCCYLRNSCECAGCKGGHYAAAQGEESECIAALTVTGRDAIAITFEDGHRSDFTFEHLRRICPCEEHAASRS